jgi:hypothetical protein
MAPAKTSDASKPTNSTKCQPEKTRPPPPPRRFDFGPLAIEAARRKPSGTALPRGAMPATTATGGLAPCRSPGCGVVMGLMGPIGLMRPITAVKQQCERHGASRPVPLIPHTAILAPTATGGLAPCRFHFGPLAIKAARRKPSGQDKKSPPNPAQTPPQGL